jgi:squalene-hopene/tetraprenyl-beta-curcumene cyclase
VSTERQLETPSSQAVSSPDPRAAQLETAIERTTDFYRSRLVPANSPLNWVGGARAAPGHEFSADNACSEGAYWVGELEADATVEADYILFCYFVDPQGYQDKIRRLAKTILAEQLEDGGWPIYPGGPSEISISVKAYFALKISGHTAEEPCMQKACATILRLGGAEQANTFTRLYLTFLKQIDWHEIPAVPPEIALLPRFFFVNIYEISYWSRVILIPLSVLYALKPDRPVEERVAIPEIFRKNHPEFAAELAPPEDPTVPNWRNFFKAAERVVRLIEQTPFKPLRKRALKAAEQWMVQRSEDSEGLGAILPGMLHGVMALLLLGYDSSHPATASNLRYLEELEIEEGGAIRLQPCLSPVWDTALALNALREADGLSADAPEAVAAARWLVSKEVRKSGDWQVRRPDLEPSGWYFQFANEFYPDIDDSAAVLLALDRVDHDKVPGIQDAMSRGLNWVVHMQSSDGGWAAFDADVTREALTHVPYADHNAMLDPTCPDVTGRVLESIGRFPEHHNVPSVARARDRGVQYLRETQEKEGCWFGRWGVNYIYGTWQALKGLIAVGEDPRADYIRRAATWLQDQQNPDGGWGESCESYADPRWRGKGVSTASQTAWAIMGLIVAGGHESEAVTRGIDYLLRSQREDGSWTEEPFTGTGFPEVFYLKYHLYAVCFPLFALGYYRNLESHRRPGRCNRFELPASSSRGDRQASTSAQAS